MTTEANADPRNNNKKMNTIFRLAAVSCWTLLLLSSTADGKSLRWSRDENESPWRPPRETMAAMMPLVLGMSPAPTAAPGPPQNLKELARRDEDNNTCGFVSGKAAIPLQCDTDSSCVFSTVGTKSAVGCCADNQDDNSCWAWTTCLHSSQRRQFTTDNGRTLYCGSSAFPSCVKDIFAGKSQSGFTLWHCAKTAGTQEVLAQATDATSSSSKSRSSSSTSKSSTTSTNATATVAGGPDASGTSDQTGSGSAQQSSSSSSSPSTGAIIGGAVGGAAAVSLLLFAVFFLIRRSRKSAASHPLMLRESSSSAAGGRGGGPALGPPPGGPLYRGTPSPFAPSSFGSTRRQQEEPQSQLALMTELAQQPGSYGFAAMGGGGGGAIGGDGGYGGSNNSGGGGYGVGGGGAVDRRFSMASKPPYSVTTSVYDPYSPNAMAVSPPQTPSPTAGQFAPTNQFGNSGGGSGSGPGTPLSDRHLYAMTVSGYPPPLRQPSLPSQPPQGPPQGGYYQPSFGQQQAQPSGYPPY